MSIFNISKSNWFRRAGGQQMISTAITLQFALSRTRHSTWNWLCVECSHVFISLHLLLFLFLLLFFHVLAYHVVLLAFCVILFFLFLSEYFFFSLVFIGYVYHVTTIGSLGGRLKRDNQSINQSNQIRSINQLKCNRLALRADHSSDTRGAKPHGDRLTLDRWWGYHPPRSQ